MQVIKRDGSTEEFDFTKIEKVLTFACPNEDDRKQFMQDLNINLKDKMSTKEIHRAITQLAVEKVGPHSVRWDAVAAKLYLYNLVKEAGLNRGYTGYKYGSFYNLIVNLTEKGLYSKKFLEVYSKEEIDELEKYMVSDRDFLFTYAGIKLLAERYLTKGYNNEILELPQENFMLNAMSTSLLEKNRLLISKEKYDATSNHYYTDATPTWSNARKPNGNYSSCFINVIDDSLDSIYDVLRIVAEVSKAGGGLGAYINIRAKNSPVQGFKNASNGIMPWLKTFESTMLSCNQLGLRLGSMAVYLDAWHLDIFDFLEAKTNVGQENAKLHNLFQGICFPDLYFKQIKKRGKWYLFCPYEIKQEMGFALEDFYGEEFEKKYWECVENKNLRKKEIKAMELEKVLDTVKFETGGPYAFFRDTVNIMNPNKHVGMIYCSNLCSEIAQNMKPNQKSINKIMQNDKGENVSVQERVLGEMVTCNLASLNIGKIYKEEDLAKVIPIIVRSLDNVIDRNNLPVKEAEYTNSRYRAIGLGVMNYHYCLVKNGIAWDSEEHLEFADKLFENIAFYTIQASMELAKEKGSYHFFEGSEWQTGIYFERRGYNSERWLKLKADVAKYGLRNAYLLAPAPNASSAILVGATAGTDPIFEKFYIEKKKNSTVPNLAPELSEYFWNYQIAHKLSQIYTIKAAARRQKHIDQSMSVNLYISSETSAIELTKLYFLAHELGMKTVYYVRSKSLEIEDDCISCSA